jgi:integrase
MVNEQAKRCVETANDQLDPNRNIAVVPKKNRARLNDRQLSDYESYRLAFLSWLLREGKDKQKAEGYSPYTVYVDSQRSAVFDRVAWKSNGGYTIPPTELDANEYFKEVAFSDRARSTKGKIQETLEHYNKWLQHEYGADEWTFDYDFDSSSGWRTKPADYFRKEERRALRQAAFDVGGDSWKLASLVLASLDGGLRPVEVMRAKTYWVDRDNHILRIPVEESSKNDDNWETSVQGRTHNALLCWLEEREYIDQYEGTDALWLTSYGNPYGSQSLNRLLDQMCEKAGIDTEHRELSWYSIRHSVGTLMTQHRDLKATKDQLRHKSPKTTMKYDQVSNEERENILGKMG